jgi:Flp pilus assembly protein TadD
MTSLRSSPKTLGYVAASAIALATIAGCTGSAHLAKAGTYGERDTARSKQGGEKGVNQAERAVARSPQNASLRAGLGLAYLQAGRFASATAAFDDAMRLGDNSPRTALSLALAKIGAGRSREAVAILDDWRDTIPASDLGLGLALAGESTRGVAILTDALRGGQNNAKLRQNLAYAYALDGRWREARAMMAQDIPADAIDSRISDWAMQGRPEDAQKRVASLLGAPVRSDPGLPQSLALADSTSVEQLAAEATAAPQQPVAVGGELPAAGEVPVATPVAGPAVAALSEMPVAATYSAPAYEAPTYEAPAYSAPAQPSAPVVQPVESSNFATAFTAPSVATKTSDSLWQARRKAPRTVRVALPAAKPVVARTGSHLVQLGSFSSPQGARRGWGVLTARNPNLREYRMVITPAVVNGRNYWRVAAAGFNSGSALGMCSSVKNRGGVCFAYASNRAPAGALPGNAQGISGPQMARRR